MFTGIITDIGTIRSHHMAGSLRLRVGCHYDADQLSPGESIACNGVCLTVVDKGTTDTAHWFDADVSQETLKVTAPESWQVNARLNLERALKIGDSLSGHFVTGHVDGVATVVDITPEGDSHQLLLEAPNPLSRFIAPKGSVTLNGVSLTVNAVEGRQFSVNIIPHTWKETNFHLLISGDKVNIEVDVLARYVDRLRFMDGNA